MHYKKLKVSAETTRKLRYLRQRTGLTPNLICRLALMSSLEEGSVAGVPRPSEDGMEFNRYTLTGELDALYVALLRFIESDVANHSDEADRELLSRLKTHLARGVLNIAARLKSPADVTRLVVAA